MIQNASPGLQPSSDHLRPPKTFADYAAIAICPVLIMLTVGGLVFFLVEVSYAGSHQGNLRWTLFWFVLAMVLVSRIAIEKGYDQAGLYGLGLAAATAFVVTQYVDDYLGVWCILGLIWWATNKLTWDCTVIDDDLDASGEGLLQTAKLDAQENRQGSAVSSDPALPPSIGPSRTSPAKSKPAKLPWWKLVYRKRAAASTEPHAPGLWVIYFSLAALPVFGLGQGLIPVRDSAARDRAFLLIVVYLTAALGLLLITSFLGLRRYLRQRHLVMPPAISATWVSMGSTLGLAILVGCLLLPRPNANWTLTAMVDRLGDPRSNAAQKTGTSPETGERSPSQESRQGQQMSGGENNDGVQQDMNRKEGPSGSGPTGKPRPNLAPSHRAPTNWLKVTAYAVLFSLVFIVILKNKQYLLLALRKCWRAFLEFWSNLFASREREGPAHNATGSQVPIRPFAAFSNPFTSGEALQMSVRDLIVYSFNALEAWAAGYQFGRHPDQTPFEFSDRLGDLVPDLAAEIQHVTRLYVQVAYADASSLPPCHTVLEILWSKMTHTGADFSQTKS